MPTPRTRAPTTAVASDEILSALQDPASYPYTPERIDIIQTHISYVAIAPPYVYKIKKPVDFGFLNFSTLDRRKHFCEVEVELNRRLCAAIYEGVVPLSQTEHGLKLEDDTNIVDYAVKMQRLSDEGFLDEHLERGTLTPDDLDRVADKLQNFYAAQTPSAEIAEAGRIPRLKVNTDENFEQAEEHVGTLLSRPAFDAIRYATDRFYDQHARLLNRRRAEGHVVDAHGDLRLEHVHLTPDRACIYDCIEFNDRFRHIDIANDIAFLAMDLDVNGRPDLSRHLVRQMADRLDDPDLPLLTDFYKSYRAFVRGKVEGMRSLEGEVPSDERAASRQRARRAYQWALRYSIAGSSPLVVVAMGRVGTGKSTQAEALADALGWEAVSSDRVRKSMANVPLYERTGAETRNRLYSSSMTKATYTTLLDRAVDHAGVGRGVILDATFSRRQHREALRARLSKETIPHVFIELTAGDETIKQRLARREQTAKQVSDARREDFEMLTAHYEPPNALEDAFHVQVSAEAPSDETTRIILKHLVRLAPEGGRWCA